MTVLAVGLTKCSCIMLIQSLFTAGNGNRLRFFEATFVAVAFWTIACAVIFNVGCPPSDILLSQRNSPCSSEVSRPLGLRPTYGQILTELVDTSNDRCDCDRHLYRVRRGRSTSILRLGPRDGGTKEAHGLRDFLLASNVRIP